MKLIHLTEPVSDQLQEAVICLAVSEAPAMVQHHIGSDSPLMPLAVSEVAILLNDALNLIGRRVPVEANGALYEGRCGLIYLVDDITSPHAFAGFIQYKVRVATGGAASIGYAAVAKEYRGQGLFRQMMDALKKVYPVLALDCPLELVPLYEKLGFYVDGAQGCHVVMVTAPPTGKNWIPNDHNYERQPGYQVAKEQVRDALGKKTRDAYAKRERDTHNRIDEIKAMLAERGKAMP